MARGGQKARLRPVRPLGRQLGRDKPFLGPFLFGDVPSDAQNADDLTALRPQRHLEFLDDCSADGQRERLLRGHQTLTGPQDPLILAADDLRVRGGHDVIVGDAGDGMGRAEPDDFREHPVSAEVPGLPVLPVDGVRQLIEDQPKGITARRQSSFLGRLRDPPVGVDHGSGHVAGFPHDRVHHDVEPPALAPEFGGERRSRGDNGCHGVVQQATMRSSDLADASAADGSRRDSEKVSGGMTRPPRSCLLCQPGSGDIAPCSARWPGTSVRISCPLRPTCRKGRPELRCVHPLRC